MKDRKILEKNKGENYLWLGLYSFLGIGLELVLVLLVEPLLWTGQQNNTQHIIHWVITCAIWGIVAAILIRFAKSRYEFDVFSSREKMRLAGWLTCVAVVIAQLLISWYGWQGFKPYLELESLGMPSFLFQYIYYAFEMLLVVLLITFGQQAGELWWKNESIPWGGFLAGLTWGLMHILSKGDVSAGLFSLISGILFGVIYVAARKRFWVAYVFVLIAFIL